MALRKVLILTCVHIVTNFFTMQWNRIETEFSSQLLKEKHKKHPKNKNMFEGFGDPEMTPQHAAAAIKSCSQLFWKHGYLQNDIFLLENSQSSRPQPVVDIMRALESAHISSHRGSIVSYHNAFMFEHRWHHQFVSVQLRRLLDGARPRRHRLYPFKPSTATTRWPSMAENSVAQRSAVCACCCDDGHWWFPCSGYWAVSRNHHLCTNPFVFFLVCVCVSVCAVTASVVIVVFDIHCNHKYDTI